MSADDKLHNRFAGVLSDILKSTDGVKLRLWDDPDEYTDAEKEEALCALFDAADELLAILDGVARG